MGNEDKEQILKNHHGLVLKHANYYFNIMKNSMGNGEYQCNLMLEDFISEGNLGLLRAIQLYDYQHDSKATFNTYAHNRVRRNCGRFLQKNSAMITRPQNLHKN